MRLAAGQVWPVLANRSHRAGEDVGRRRSREGEPDHAGHAENEKDRHQGPAAGVRREVSHPDTKEVREPGPTVACDPVVTSMLKMKKIDIKGLQQAYDGK